MFDLIWFGLYSLHKHHSNCFIWWPKSGMLFASFYISISTYPISEKFNDVIAS